MGGSGARGTRFLVGLAAAVCGAVAAGAGTVPFQVVKDAIKVPEATAPAPKPPAGGAQKPAAGGGPQRPGGGGASGLVLVYQDTRDAGLRPVEQMLKESQLFEAVVEDVNSYLVFPKQLPVVFTDCDEPNAFYDPSAGRMILCYQLVGQFLADFDDEGADPEDVKEQALDSMTFTFYHELGHALVDLYDLPITGKEEDAVDELAAVVLIEADEDDVGEQMALNGAEAFYRSSVDPEDLTDDHFADEHSLDQQRYFDIICLVYGSNPDGFQTVVDDYGLPEERAVRCAGEYEQKSNAWDRLLEDHYRPDEG